MQVQQGFKLCLIQVIVADTTEYPIPTDQCGSGKNDILAANNIILPGFLQPGDTGQQQIPGKGLP